MHQPVIHAPDPNDPHPMAGYPRVCYIKNTVHNPNILIGDYTYYDDPVDSEGFERNVLYHFPMIGDKLIIGRFCAIATGTRFIMNGANHLMQGFSAYPFPIFGGQWEESFAEPDEAPSKGDTHVGNDVWIGYEATILPGVRIGDGVIIGAKAVVARDVPPYSIVAGNPARILRKRFADEVITELLEIAWWDWPIEKITRNLHLIAGGEVEALRDAR